MNDQSHTLLHLGQCPSTQYSTSDEWNASASSCQGVARSRSRIPTRGELLLGYMGIVFTKIRHFGFALAWVYTMIAFSATSISMFSNIKNKSPLDIAKIITPWPWPWPWLPSWDVLQSWNMSLRWKRGTGRFSVIIPCCLNITSCKLPLFTTPLYWHFFQCQVPNSRYANAIFNRAPYPIQTYNISTCIPDSIVYHIQSCTTYACIPYPIVYHIQCRLIPYSIVHHVQSYTISNHKPYSIVYPIQSYTISNRITFPIHKTQCKFFSTMLTFSNTVIFIQITS